MSLIATQRSFSSIHYGSSGTYLPVKESYNHGNS